MRGSQSDNNIGMIVRAPQMSAPYDRIVMDLNVVNPIQATPQGLNAKFSLFSRRNRPDDRIETVAQTTPISLDPNVPNHLKENGSSPLPYAGIYKFIG